MSDPTNRAHLLPITVALVAGECARTVSINATTDLARIPRLSADHWLAKTEHPPIASVVEAFLEAVDLGCFKTAGAPGVKVVRRDANQSGDIREEAWEVELPALPEGAFDTLARAAESSAMMANGLTAFALVEHAPPDVPRIARDALRPLRPEPWPFAVQNALGGDGESKDMRILATFVDDVDDAIFEAVRALFETWGKLLRWGGFPPTEDLPYSTGFVADVSRHLPEEVVAEVHFFSGTEAAWSALCRGFVRVHRRAALASLEVG